MVSLLSGYHRTWFEQGVCQDMLLEVLYVLERVRTVRGVGDTIGNCADGVHKSYTIVLEAMVYRVYSAED